MYWYKCWCEVRVRVLIGMATMAAACIFIVYYQHPMRFQSDEPSTYATYIWKTVYNSFGRDLFVILTIALASGGLLQERASKTLGFTLALPVSRRRAIAVRATVGYLGVVAMALTPAVVIPLLSPYAGVHYAAAQAMEFSLLFACTGAAIYGLAYLLAYFMEGEYSAMLVTVPALMAYGALLQLPWLHRVPMLDIFKVMNGEDMPFFNETQHLITGSLPWLTLTVMLCVAGSFVLAACRRMGQRDI
jgi:ABC-2 type transport system permease protein